MVVVVLEPALAVASGSSVFSSVGEVMGEVKLVPEVRFLSRKSSILTVSVMAVYLLGLFSSMADSNCGTTTAGGRGEMQG